tara:strand:- start:100 stop:948 length:849 start_codon:yes stop_codon:yes gene_type:complete
METGENKPIIIKSKDFLRKDLAENGHLSIQVGDNYLSYCILDTNSLTYNYIREYKLRSTENYAREITNIINQDEIIRNDFLSTSVAYLNTPSTLIPEKFYKKEDEYKFLQFQTEINGDIMSDYISCQAAYLIYSVPTHIREIINTFFPENKEKSQESILIEQYNNLDKEQDNTYLYLNEGKATITTFRNKKLIFNNTFKYITKEDLLYFVLFCFEQLKLSNETTSLIIYGNIEAKDIYFNILYDYVRNIKLGSRPHQLLYSDEFNSIKKHKYFGLFSQVLCV